ncbi:MAG TPA: hypothetical protein PLH39_00435, partial [Promineifilum sp.]|nr:hypothetical protein [Promineifilum sp.]
LILSDDFRRFIVVQLRPEEIVAYGTQFPDMTCVLLWSETPSHVLNFANIQDAQRVVLRIGGLELRWLDEREEMETVLAVEDEEEERWLMEAALL